MKATNIEMNSQQKFIENPDIKLPQFEKSRLLKIKKNKEKADELIQKGNAFYGKSKYKEAISSYQESIKYFDDAIKFSCDICYAYNNMGMAYQKLYELRDLSDSAVDTNYENAKSCYNKAIELNQNFIPAYEGLTKLGFLSYSSVEQSESSSNSVKAWILRGILDDKRKKAQEDFKSAEYFLADGKYDKAVESYNNAIKFDDTDYIAYNNKGLALHYMQKFNEAEICFRNVIKLNPIYAEGYCNRGMVLDAMDCSLVAIENYDIAIMLEPGLVNAYNNKGEAYKKLYIATKSPEYYEKAKDSYSKAIKINPSFTVVYKNLVHLLSVDFTLVQNDHVTFNKIKEGVLFEKRGMYKEAIECFDEAIGRLKQDDFNTKTVLFLNKGVALRKIGKLEEALEYFDKSIECNPKNFNAYNEKGKVLKAFSAYEEALDCYDQAIALNPYNDDFWHDKGILLFALKQYESAIKCFDKSIEINQNVPDSFCEKGNVLAKIGQHTEATECYDFAIRLGDIQAFYDKSLLLLNNKDAESALKLIDAAIEIFGSNSVYLYKGLLLQKMFRYNEALEYFNIALKKHVDVMSLCCKGVVLNFLGRSEEAFVAFNKVDQILRSGHIGFFSTGAVQHLISTLNPIIALHKADLKLKEKLSKLGSRLDNMKEEVENLFSKKNKLISETMDIFIKKLSGKSDIDNDKELKELVTGLHGITKEFSDVYKFIDSASTMIGNVLLEVIEVQKSNDMKLLDMLKEQGETLVYSGTYDKAEIKKGFIELAIQNSSLNIYCKTFYWTLLNYFAAYKSLSTGVIQGNLKSVTEVKQTVMEVGIKKIVSFAAEISKEIPIIGGVVSGIDNIINQILTGVKNKKLQDRVAAINKIIMYNNDPNFQLDEDISLNIAKAALEITKRKHEEIINPKTEDKKGLEKIANWLESKIKILKDALVGQGVELYESPVAEKALKDVTLLLAYMYKNYFIIVNKVGMSLAEQIQNIVLGDNSKPILESLNNSMESGKDFGEVKEKTEACCRGKCEIFMLPKIIYDNDIIDHLMHLDLSGVDKNLMLVLLGDDYISI